MACSIPNVGVVCNHRYLGFAGVHRAGQTIHTSSPIVHLGELVTVVDADPDDNKSVALAVASHAEMIISGDGHLLELGNYRDIAILTPTQFLDHVTKRQPGESA